LELIVVGGNRALYAGLDLSFTSDIIPGFGPLSGLHAALSACGKPWLYLLACDMPRFSIAWLKYLLASASGSGGEGMPDTLAVAASFGPHVEPFHALYSKACLDRLEAYIAGGCQGGRRPSIQGFLRRIGALLVPESEQAGLGLDRELFLNINTPEQLTL
ncbi:MAG TPA: molybdenum cofactor guanylyltransferase, partial [Rectinemataceae bacterium]